MLYARVVSPAEILGLASIPWQNQISSLSGERGAVWSIATPVRDADMPLAKCKFGRSITDECNDKGKRLSLVTMVTALHHAAREEDYQGALKGLSGIGVKEAFNFAHLSKKERVWELKYQNKDRMYFFAYTEGGPHPRRILLPLLYHHKRDQNTPDGVKRYCSEAMKPFLEPRAKVVILK